MRASEFIRLVIALVVVCIASAVVLAQDPRGGLRGKVLDPSGAPVPEVEIQATDASTGVTVTARTNEAGMYSLPFLPPGNYKIVAQRTGFKQFVRTAVVIRVAEIVELNINLELGPVTESITVAAETPLLDTAGASLGQVVDQRRILELPIAAGNPLELSLLTPGMVEPSKWVWRPAWNFRNITTDGNPAYTTEYQLDGVSNTFAEGNAGRSRYAFAPPATAVREFKIQTTAYDASVGHTMSAVVNVSTTSGTNELRGSAHWYLKNSALDAPNFFNNKYGTKRPVYQDNRYGASGGGPLYLPRLYDGRNRSFWHYSWEANKWGVPQTFTGTVPTPAQRRGDFSELLKLGSRYQIYDPATIAPAPGGRYSRQPLPNNVIPAHRLDPVGLKLVELYPLPNQAGTADGINNYFNGSMKGLQDYFVHLARVDHNFSAAHRAFVRLHYDWWEEDKDRRFGPASLANGIILNRINRGLALDDVLVLDPSLVVNLRYGLTHQEFLERRISRGFDLSSLGFSQRLVSLVDRRYATIPRISAGPYAEISRWESGDGATTSLTHTMAAHVNKLKGQHNLKFGADFRVYRAFNNRFPAATSPVFSFPNYYTRGPLDNSPAAPIGQELAAMLLGIPGGSMERTASFAMQDLWLGTYLHDDLKIGDKLTLNLGLRYELERPVTERFDRLVAGFDYTTPNPIEEQARAKYRTAPIPELPPEQFRVTGGLTWVATRGLPRSPFRGEKNNFMPRFGLSYQLTSSTTLRGGYGIFFDSIGVNATRPIQTGFSQSTPIQASLDEGLTYVATIADPFPRGLLEPLGPAGGLKTNLGQSLEFYFRDRKHPYSQRWSLGLQQLVFGRFLVEASYVGNRGTRLAATSSVNNTPREYLSTSPLRDQKVIDYLSQTFPSPFFGLDPVFGERISRAALLRPYPHFGTMSVAEPVGYSWYHSLQVRLEKRFSEGYTFQLAYTWSKLMEAVEFLNATDPLPYECVGSFDRPHRLVMTGIWELPFGKGRRFGSGSPSLVQAIAGNWKLTGIVVRQAGPALGFGNAIFLGNIKDIPLPKSQRSVDRWFNTEAGFNRNPAEQLAYNIRTFPLRFSGIRGDGRANWDFAAIKSFPLREPLSLEFRAAVYNAWNHPNFASPNTSPTSTAFGRITSAEDARSWQFSLTLKF